VISEQLKMILNIQTSTMHNLSDDHIDNSIHQNLSTEVNG